MHSFKSEAISETLVPQMRSPEYWPWIEYADPDRVSPAWKCLLHPIIRFHTFTKTSTQHELLVIIDADEVGDVGHDCNDYDDL